jgi:hypothetical protein
MPFPALQDGLYGVFIVLEYQDSGHWFFSLENYLSVFFEYRNLLDFGKH